MANSRFTKWLAVLSCVAMAFSQAATASERVAPIEPVVRDVTLQADGSLVGRVLNANGKAIDGAVVTLAQGEQVLGQTTTDAEGVYRFPATKGGVYRVTAGQETRHFRVWPEKTSPPSAQSYAAIVMPTGVVRGQLGPGTGTVLGIGAGVTGVVLGIIAIDKANDAEDEAAELRAILNSMSP